MVAGDLTVFLNMTTALVSRSQLQFSGSYLGFNPNSCDSCSTLTLDFQNYFLIKNTDILLNIERFKNRHICHARRFVLMLQPTQSFSESVVEGKRLPFLDHEDGNTW